MRIIRYYDQNVLFNMVEKYICILVGVFDSPVSPVIPSTIASGHTKKQTNPAELRFKTENDFLPSKAKKEVQTSPCICGGSIPPSDMETVDMVPPFNISL